MSTATVTAKIGAAVQATSVALTGVTNIQFDTVKETVQVTCDQGVPIFSLTGSNTITLTVSSGVYALSIS